MENRPLNENRWHYTFTHRFFPDYYQTYGMGLYKYFLLSEDIGAEPLPVLNCGLACQYQNNKEECHVALNQLDSYIQDALDMIEFANGATDSQWGKVRTAMGHPEPFHLKFIGIGNEQWGNKYVVRLAAFVKAIREKYPEIKIIGSSGPSADGKEFDYLWPEMKKMKLDLVDEHYYKEPEWFLQNANRYDLYDRKGPAVFVGEYACHVPDRANNFQSALCEAAFMTGLERNADIVHLCTYAPLLAHVDAWQWRPDLLWFNNLRLIKTPNYYVQQLYAQNKGSHVVSLTSNREAIAGQNKLYASAVYDKDGQCYVIKVVNIDNFDKEVTLKLTNLKKGVSAYMGECLQMNANLEQSNTFDASPVVPRTTTAQLDGDNVRFVCKGNSFGVYKVQMGKR